MRLGDIVDLGAADAALASREIGGLCADSRKVARGDAFFALAGVKSDGLAFAAQAVERGAAAIVGERAPDFAVPAFAQVADARAALALAASRFYSRQPEVVVGITGTSGKTSVAAFVRRIWASLGFESASLGTIGVVSRPVSVYGSLTTPDPVALHRTLDGLAGQPARVLSGGQRKLLEIARALIAEPKLLLLDEPAAGVNPRLLNVIVERMIEINRRGVAILVIEHNMDVIARLCGRVFVMASGKLLSEGRPSEVVRDPRVIDAYLGGAE